ncbi:MAG: DUF6588 family protein [Ghiorsea sp.]
MKMIRTLFAVSALLVSGQAHAFTADPQSILNQAQSQAQGTFAAFASDLSTIAWMNPSNSAEPHSNGLIPVGGQAAIEASFLTIDPNDPHWSLFKVPSDLTSIPLPKFRLSVGVPFGIDAGVMYLSLPKDSGIELDLVGYELRKSLGGFVPLPFFEANIRGYMTNLSVGSELEVSSTGFAVMVGADLPFVKPYLEVGTVNSTTTPAGSLVSGLVKLQEVSESYNTVTIGVKAQLALFIINLERSSIGDKELLSAKIGLEF